GVAGVPVPEVLREWGSGRRLKPILLVALLVAVLGSAYLLLSLVSDQSGTTATPGANRASASTPTAGSTPKASEAPSATARAPRSTVAVPARSSDERLASFISSYYATVTTDRDVTWAQLSPTMQAFAKGRNGYDGFWQTVRSVRVNQVDANASARSAVVNLTYTMRNGRTRTETHSFAFVTNGAGYLIQTDR
ncbi:MAG: hypothetical protein ABI903_02530, partial [Actinomycetota bacterium]